MTETQPSELSEIQPISLGELRGNVTTGILDKVRLTAKYAVASAAGAVHEYIENAKAVWRDKDPLVYNFERARRRNEMLQGIGKWALEQEMIPDRPLTPISLPHHERLI